MTPSFREALEECLAAIPRGKVATCGTVATALGDVRAARSVATWLSERPGTPGAERVVRADGRPVVLGAVQVLQREGVQLRDGRVEAARFVASLRAAPFLETLRALQRRLVGHVSEADAVDSPRILGGVDVAYSGDRAFAVAVNVDAETLETLEVSDHEGSVEFPYIPTYLAFREFPPVQSAFEGLRQRPDVLFVDGHGRLHPERFGFACFAGVQLDVPTIGIAKHPLAGRAAPGAGRLLDAIPVQLGGAVEGYAWTPPGSAHAFYVSVGHRISLRSALVLAQRATRRRYPEPLLVADQLSKEKKSKKNPERSASGRHARRRTPAQKQQGV